MNHSSSNSVFKSRSQNQRGFSLIEIMVVVGIMAILGLAISTMMVNSQKETRSVSAKSDFNSLVTSIQGYLNNSKSCVTAFGGKYDAAGNLTQEGMIVDTIPGPPDYLPVTLDIGGTSYNKGFKYSNELKIEQLAITQKDKGTDDQTVLTLTLVGDRGQGGTATTPGVAVGGAYLKHEFKVLALIDDTTKKIKGCSGMYTDYWVASATTKSPYGADIKYPGGYVGVLVDPETALDVKGTAQADAFMYRSDARLKENVRDLSNSLENILKLRGVVFNWNKESSSNRAEQIGLIAQEVEQVFPEMVMTNPRSGMKSVAYANLVSPLIEAIKEQQKIIKDQQQQIDEIKKALEEMKKE